MSLYRCAECGHGKHLTAWAQACSFGPLGADGQLLTHDDVEDCFLFVDSIQCERHPSAAIQTKVGARFHVWETCPKCGGDGKSPYRYACPDCNGRGGDWALPATAANSQSEPEA